MLIWSSLTLLWRSLHFSRGLLHSRSFILVATTAGSAYAFYFYVRQISKQPTQSASLYNCHHYQIANSASVTKGKLVSEKQGWVSVKYAKIHVTASPAFASIFVQAEENPLLSWTQFVQTEENSLLSWPRSCSRSQSHTLTTQLLQSKILTSPRLQFVISTRCHFYLFKICNINMVSPIGPFGVHCLSCWLSFGSIFLPLRPCFPKINTLSLNDIARYATLCWRRPALVRRARRSSTTSFLARGGLQSKKKILRASLVGIDRTRAPLPTSRLRSATKWYWTPGGIRRITSEFSPWSRSLTTESAAESSLGWILRTSWPKTSQGGNTQLMNSGAFRLEPKTGSRMDSTCFLTSRVTSILSSPEVLREGITKKSGKLRLLPSGVSPTVH